MFTNVNIIKRFCISKRNYSTEVSNRKYFYEDIKSFNFGPFEYFNGLHEVNYGAKNNVIVLRLNKLGKTKGLVPLQTLNNSILACSKKHPKLQLSLLLKDDTIKPVKTGCAPELSIANIKKPDIDKDIDSYDNEIKMRKVNYLKELKQLVMNELNNPFVSTLDDSPKSPLRITVLSDVVDEKEYIPDSIIFTLPRILADPLSSISLVNDILTDCRLLTEKKAIKEETLPVLGPVYKMYSPNTTGIKGIIKNNLFKLRLMRKRLYTYKLRYDMHVEPLERTSLYENVRIASDIVESIKKLAEDHSVSFTSILSAASLVALRVCNLESYGNKERQQKNIVMAIHDDIRKTLTPPLDTIHLGSIYGSIFNVYDINKDIWVLIKEIDEYNKEYVANGDLFRSHGCFDLMFGQVEDVKGTYKIKNLSLEIANLGKAKISKENIKFFGVDEIMLSSSNHKPNFFVTIVTLPDGDMNLTVNYPYPTFLDETAIDFKAEVVKTILKLINFEQ